MQEPDKNQLRFALVGAGGRGRYHATQIDNNPRATVVAAIDISETARIAAGDQLNLSSDSLYDSYETMLAEETLDAVFIATPHTLHYEQIITAMNHRLHVLCEKPLTTNSDHAKELVQRAEQAEQLLMPGYQRHIDPAYVTARQQWQDRDSRPTMITAEISQNWIQRQADTWRTNPELSGGGMLYDTGSHILDALLWMTALTPTAVTANMTFLDDAQRVDTSASLLIEFEDDITATVSIGGHAGGVREHYHLWDANGGIFIEGDGWDLRSLSIIEDNEEQSVKLVEPERNKVEAFIAAIYGDTELPATVHDAMRATVVTEAAYEAARTGNRVSIDLEL